MPTQGGSLANIPLSCSQMPFFALREIFQFSSIIHPESAIRKLIIDHKRLSIYVCDFLGGANQVGTKPSACLAIILGPQETEVVAAANTYVLIPNPELKGFIGEANIIFQIHLYVVLFEVFQNISSGSPGQKIGIEVLSQRQGNNIICGPRYRQFQQRVLYHMHTYVRRPRIKMQPPVGMYKDINGMSN